MSALMKILRYAGDLWPYYVGIIVMSVLMSATALAAPFIIKLATDLIVASIDSKSADIAGALWLAVALFGVDVLNTLVTNYGGYLGDMMSIKLRAYLSERYYFHLLRLPQAYYDNELTGKIINRLNRTITEVTQFLNIFANNFFQMFLTMILTLLIVGYYSWELAVLLFILYPVFMWLTAKTSKRWQVLQDKKNTEHDIASGRFNEVVSQIRVVKSFIQETIEFRHFSKHYQKTISLTSEQSKYWHKMDVLRRLVLNVIFFGVFAYLFINTASGRFTIGEMVLLIQLVNMVRFPIFNMSFIVDNTQRAIAGSKDYFSVMETEPEIKDVRGAKRLKVARGEVSYQNVSFGYDGNSRVLQDISFTVKPGEKIAFVGESGEGKTTLTSLLLRLYEVRDGEVAVDGESISSVTQESLRQNIGVVFQEPALFSGTIRENIAYANPRASLAQIEKAAKAANAHEFISKLDKGFDTQIGERGLKLSGGQKQRIAIARAILKDAPILILDEATSSLDSRAETLVQEALNRLMKGRTTLIIAHRLSTIAHVDRIITLRGGRIDEIGTPAELSKTDGIYAQLLQLQMGATEAAKKSLQKFEITT